MRRPCFFMSLHFQYTYRLNKKIKKILIANRGEIALRIVRACKELNIPSVAVYSDPDRAGLHVAHADEAYRLGPAPATESYLRGDLILEVARQSGADAIHPGYGFLSENADFAAACEAAAVRFIGPTADAMRMLGSKTRARQSCAVRSVTARSSVSSARAIAASAPSIRARPNSDIARVSSPVSYSRRARV